MNREEVARGRAKSLLESFSRGRAVQLDMLHNMLIVCLGAYVIAGSRGYPSGRHTGLSPMITGFRSPVPRIRFMPGTWSTT